MEPKKDCINVSVRIRPVLNQDSNSSSCLQIISKEPPVLLVLERSQTYHFDNIFAEDADQQKVYNDAVKPFVNCVKMGYNCTVFAYGQTGTGKTYTMGSGTQKPLDTFDAGIIPRALEQLFDNDHLNSDQEIEVFISFSEIYNEKVFDLFQTEKKAPLPVSGFVVQGLSIKTIKSIKEAKELLELGNKNRHVGETKQNLNSSRSHAIFTVYYSMRNSHEEISGKLNLVDLAGSESVRKTGSQGSTFQEGININKGLLSIGQVISALSLKSSYVPYRQSMITSILQGSLNADNYISLIACLSGNPDDLTETLQSLDFAQRVKKVRNRPEVNQIIAKYKKEHPGAFGFVKTPMKRAYSTPLKTPAAKRMAFPPLPLIDESRQSQMSNVDNSKSRCSIDVSSVSSLISANTDVTQQTLSPVIRKYMTKMEVSIMDRLETVIKSTLRRPTRASLLAEQSRGDNKENTPSVSWNKIQNEVSKMVRNEIEQMSAQVVRATSSPIEEMEKDKARRVLIYDSPENIDPAKSTPQSPTENVLFKVPELPLQKKKRNVPSKLSISPIENQMPKLTPRKSIRLSLKKMDSSLTNNNTLNMSINDNTLCISDVSFDIGVRCQTQTLNDTTTSICETSVTGNHPNLSKVQYESGIDDCEVSRASILNSARKKRADDSLMSSKRKSVRIAKKREIPQYESPKNDKKKIGFNVAMTPAKILLRKQKIKDSPYTAHSKKVLKVLNEGSLKEVQKLHTIGEKTAEQIFLFRKLKGSLKEIEDLTKVPGWGTRRYEKFVALNFLKKD